MGYKKGDTIKTAGINTKIMITVTDSTKKGYDMEYSFLDFKTDSVKDSWKQNLLNEALDKYKEAMKGTTINSGQTYMAKLSNMITLVR